MSPLIILLADRYLFSPCSVPRKGGWPLQTVSLYLLSLDSGWVQPGGGTGRELVFGRRGRSGNVFLPLLPTLLSAAVMSFCLSPQILLSDLTAVVPALHSCQILASPSFGHIRQNRGNDFPLLLGLGVSSSLLYSYFF